MTHEKNLYTIKELAKMKQISRQAIDKRIRKSKIECERYGRTRVIKKEDLHLLD